MQRQYQQCHQCHTIPRPYKIIPAPKDSPHLYKKVCPDCQRYIAWAPRGEVEYIALLSSIDMTKLNEKEYEFVTKSVRYYMIKGYKLSLKQELWLNDIIKKYGIN